MTNEQAPIYARALDQLRTELATAQGTIAQLRAELASLRASAPGRPEWGQQMHRDLGVMRDPALDDLERMRSDLYD